MITAHHDPSTTALLRKLERLVTLTDEDRHALECLPFARETVASRRVLVREGEQVMRCCLLVQGYAARYKVARSGRRQIVSFHVAGDMLDLQHSLLPRADHSVQTVGAATVAWVAVRALKEIALSHPRIAEGFARDALIDASIFREWVLNVGARDARTRVAHMLCEFVARREAAGIAKIDALQIPFTQEEIGDATGLTSVHVNRMLRALAEDGAFSRTGRDYVITDWEKLKTIADFDPAYLHAAA